MITIYGKAIYDVKSKNVIFEAPKFFLKERQMIIDAIEHLKNKKKTILLVLIPLALTSLGFFFHQAKKKWKAYQKMKATQKELTKYAKYHN